MYELIKISLIGFGAGFIGTVLGGMLGLILTYLWDKFEIKSEKKIKELIYSSLIEFTSGLMIAIVSFDLLPEVFLLGGTKRAVVGIILGLFVMVIFQNLIYSMNLKGQKNKNKTLMTGIFFVISIAMHNLPEGIAIGSSYLISSKLAFSIALAIALHNIPEGMISTILLKSGGMGLLKTICAVVAVEIPIGMGVLIGGIIGKISNEVVTLCLSFAAGAMLYVCVGDLLRESKEMYSGRLPSVFNILGMVMGIMVSLI